MFYIVEVNDYVRVEPRLFGLATKDAVEQQLKEMYKDYFGREFGFVISVIGVGSCLLSTADKEVAPTASLLYSSTVESHSPQPPQRPTHFKLFHPQLWQT